MTTFPYETFNELTQQFKRYIETSTDGVIEVSQPEWDMYASYIKDPEVKESPENLTFQGFTLRVKHQ